MIEPEYSIERDRLDWWPLVGHDARVAFALAREQQRFIARMVRVGRFNNQSEVVREALRRMAAAETAYLTPAPWSGREVEQVYGSEDERERTFGQAAFRAIRRAGARGRRA